MTLRLVQLAHELINFEYREENRQQEIKELTSKGVLPIEMEIQKDPSKSMQVRPWLMGKVASRIDVSRIFAGGWNQIAEPTY